MRGAFGRALRAEGLKLRRLPLAWAHGAVAVGTALAFAAYFAVSPFDPAGKAGAYLQVLGVGMPLLVGAFAAFAAECERAAGNGASLRGAPSRAAAVLAKLTVLVALGTATVIAAGLLFGALFTFAEGQRVLGMGAYALASLAVAGSSVFLYALHLGVSLKLGRNASLGLGLLETVAAAIMLTGLGEGIWPFLPCAWGARFAGSVAAAALSPDLAGILGGQAGFAAALCAGLTVVGVALLAVWFARSDVAPQEE